MKTGLVSEALEMALSLRKPGPGLLHHSERGVQYASREFQDILTAHRVTCSMSRRGECYDNAVVESFFHSLKTELVYLSKHETRKEASQAMFEYIEVSYNRERLHSSLDYRSPVEFEQEKKIA